tara:strand:+ start:1493 stop:1747 length:255 start_codon:yes stop_codon:yes gene_type:complete
MLLSNEPRSLFRHTMGGQTKLEIVKSPVPTALGQERFVIAILDETAILEDEDLVGTLNCRQSMGNNKYRTTFDKSGQRVLNEPL